MKNFFKYLLIITFFSVWGIMLRNKIFVQNAVTGAKKTVSQVTGIELPCAKPLRYAIGSVDPRFNLSTNDLLAEVEDAEKIWKAQSGKNLFEYDPGAEFKINLIFDERQLQSNEADALTKNLNQLEASHEQIVTQYKNLSGTYAQSVAKYNAGVANYQKKMDDYNRAVSDWNKNGGSQAEYDKLKKDKSGLEDLQGKLEKERLAVNSLAGKTNALVSEEKNVINNYNANVATYKNKYGSGREFEKGLYDGKEINLYQFKQMSDLRLTIIHELGHALGIGHVDNPKSIMYYLLSDQDMENPQLSSEDLSALKTACQF